MLAKNNTKIDRVVNMEIKDEVLVERVTGECVLFF